MAKGCARRRASEISFRQSEHLPKSPAARRPSWDEITYTLSPSVAVPAEVQVGRQVTLYTERGKDGATQVVSVGVHLDARPTANTLTRISPATKPPT